MLSSVINLGLNKITIFFRIFFFPIKFSSIGSKLLTSKITRFNLKSWNWYNLFGFCNQQRTDKGTQQLNRKTKLRTKIPVAPASQKNHYDKYCFNIKNPSRIHQNKSIWDVYVHYLLGYVLLIYFYIFFNFRYLIKQRYIYNIHSIMIRRYACAPTLA